MMTRAWSHTLRYLTNFADAAVTLPLAALVMLLLLLWRRADLARPWAETVGLALALILVLKLVFGIWPGLGRPIDVQSPSGHTSSSSVVYGGALLLLSGRPILAVMAAGTIALVVGLSRIDLGAHSLSEVVIGGAVGVLGVTLLAREARHHVPLRATQSLALAGLVAIAAGLLHGRHAHIESRLKQIEIAAAQRLGSV